MTRLEGKTAIITGGSGGIGRSAAAMFADEGANVVIVDLDQGGLDEALSDIGSNRVSGFVADVTRSEDNEQMVRETVARYGGVDILLANAGIEGQVKPIVDYDEAVFDKVLAVNVKGVWLGIKHVVPAMRERGGGSIVVTSSVAGLRGSANFSAYSTSKHAVIGLMRSAAKELSEFGIRVNTVNPSPVETRMMRSIEAGIAPDSPEEVHERIKQSIPLGRYAEPSDIAKVMLFLASDDAAWVTGSVYAADGGNTA